MNKLFNFYFENPLKTYNKIKKYFKPLTTKIEISFYKSNKAKILEIYSYDLMWKDKYNSPRHEYNPRIFIHLFNYIHIYINYIIDDNSINDMIYWEAALYWLYYEKTLKEAIKESSGWTEYDKIQKCYIQIKFRILKEPYQTMYNENKLPEIKYEQCIKN